MSRGDTYITFRGEPDVLVDWDIDHSGPGSGCSVEWKFHGKTPEEHLTLAVTDKEENEIIEACIQASVDRQEGDF